MRSKRQTEHQLQAACVRWWRIQHPKKARLLFAIPNGARLHGSGKQRAIQWARLEREGAVAGAADLLLAIPSGDLGGLFIEMKTPRGRQSDKQKAFERAVLDAGYGYAMPRSFDEFVIVVRAYLERGEY